MKFGRIGIAFLILLLVGGGIIPSLKKNKTLSVEIAQLTEQKKNLDTRLNTLKESTKNLSGDEISKKIPFTLKQESIIRNLQEIESQTGFKFSNLSFSKGINNQVGAPELRVNFSTQGPKNKLRQFLYTIENHPRFMGMDSLSITTAQEGGQEMVQFAVSLFTFAQS